MPFTDFKKSYTRIKEYKIELFSGKPVTTIGYDIKILNPRQPAASYDEEAIWHPMETWSTEADYKTTVTALSKVTNLPSIIAWARSEFDKGLTKLSYDSAGVRYSFPIRREVEEGEGKEGINISVYGDATEMRMNMFCGHRKKLPLKDIVVRNTEILFDAGQIEPTAGLRRKPGSHLSFLEVIRQGDVDQLRRMIDEATPFKEKKRLRAEDRSLQEKAASAFCNPADRQLFDIAHHFTEVYAASQALGRRR